MWFSSIKLIVFARPSYFIILLINQIFSYSLTGVLFPPKKKLNQNEVFDARTGKPQPEVLKQHFIVEGRIEESAALRIIQEGATLLKTENTMIDIEAPVTGNGCFTN